VELKFAYLGILMFQQNNKKKQKQQQAHADAEQVRALRRII